MGVRRVVCALVALALALPSALAQDNPSPTGSFFQIFNGSVSGGSSGVTVTNGDLIAAVIDGQAFTSILDEAGEFNGLTVTRTTNDADPVRFEMRRGAARYALTIADDSDVQFQTPYNGSSNPLSAAFNAQTVRLFVGNQLSGPGAGGGGGDGDGDDVTAAGPDVDGDGVVTQDDAQLVMRFIIGMRRGIEDASSRDVNGDGFVNTDDVVEILRRIGETVSTGGEEGDDAGASAG